MQEALCTNLLLLLLLPVLLVPARGSSTCTHTVTGMQHTQDWP
jgi:hypothetical protein